MTANENDHRDEERTAAIVTLTEDLLEFEDLARSAGYSVLYESIQRRRGPARNTFVGKGKLEELKKLLKERPVQVLLINGDLRPSQHYLLENELKVECVDRIRLVLNIFSTRAFSREARLQVLRARLRYEIPFLREWVHNAKSGEHPGFLGAGEYETDAYYELIRRQLSRVEQELAKMDRDRSLRRDQRKKRGFCTVAIAGYTNAGKSSLLNILANERALVENRMFSTLSTTTGRLEEGVNKQILLTDTIGFLSDLPHFMIESFKSTIDEIYYADLALLVIDASDPDDVFRKKLETSAGILFPEVDPSSIIIVLSKLDKVRDVRAKAILAASTVPCREVVAVSSMSGEGMPQLREAIALTFQFPVEMRFRLPHGEGVEAFLSWLHDHTEVLSVDYGDSVEVHLFCREKDHSNIVSRVVALKGTPVSTA